MTTSRYTDHTLLLRMAAGEEEAFNLLFNKYWDKVYSTVLVLTKSNLLAEDIAQEVFLRMWQNRHKTDIIDNLEGFLFITARNLIYNKLSRLKLEQAYTNYLKYQLPLSESDTETETEFRQLKTILEEGMRQLPPQQQKAFRLSRENGLSHEEISLRMGVSRGTVKDYIVKAIAFLRKYLHDHALEVFLLILSRLK